MKTTGAAAKLLMKADHAEISADGQDLSFITVTIADKDGLLVPRSKNRMNFETRRPRRNHRAWTTATPPDLESFQSKERKAYNGLILVIVRTKSGVPGQIKLTAQADGLAGSQTVIRTR